MPSLLIGIGIGLITGSVIFTRSKRLRDEVLESRVRHTLALIGVLIAALGFVLLVLEKRNLEKGAIYVYNIAEDLNTRIIEPMQEICPRDGSECDTENSTPNPFSWYPDSAHLLYLKDRKIHIVEIDGANLTTIYAGPFLGDYVFPWPDGSKVVILTNLGNPSVAPTLYTVGLK